MFETTRYETNRRLRGTLILTVGVSLYVAFIVWYFSLVDASAYEQIAESVPPAMRTAFGIQTIGTIEGWLGGQIYTFVWLVGLGVYFAYSGAGRIASDIENDRMDLLLSFPVSRSQLLLEKFASMLLPLIMLNVVVGGVTYGFVVAIGETIDPMHLVLAHLLSIPYLLVCAAIGITLSVLVNRAAVAERAAIPGIAEAVEQHLGESSGGCGAGCHWADVCSLARRISSWRGGRFLVDSIR